MASSPALIDFLIPQFRDERIIRAIRSIIEHPQSADFRIVVLDGGDDELLQAEIGRLLRRHDVHRIAPDRGIYDALNIGLAMATADWIGWIGSDDLLARTFSTRPLADAATATAFVAYATLFFSDADGAVTRVYRPVRSRLLRRHGFHLPHFSTFVRTAAAKSLTFDISQRNYADQLFMFDLESRRSGEVVDVVATLMCEGGVSNSSRSAIIKTNLEVATAMSSRQGRVRAVVYVVLKLLYKINQRAMARLRPVNIAAYRTGAPPARAAE